MRTELWQTHQNGRCFVVHVNARASLTSGGRVNAPLGRRRDVTSLRRLLHKTWKQRLSLCCGWDGLRLLLMDLCTPIVIKPAPKKETLRNVRPSNKLCYASCLQKMKCLKGIMSGLDKKFQRFLCLTHGM